jgi:flagellar motility protein MotE (MotC chaperone)
MTKILTSPWMVMPVGMIVYALSTMLFWKIPAAPSAPEGTEHGVAEVNRLVPSWEFMNPEADQLIAELKSEKAALDKREKELNDLAVRLNAERAEINQITQSVHGMQVDFDKMVLRVQTEETANLKKLGKVYATMSPEGAATILSEMDDTAIVKIMLFMKDSETAAILESLSKRGDNEAKRAASISERLRVSAFRNTPTK